MLRDLCRLTGEPPLLPAYALGNWWSHDIGGHHHGCRDDNMTALWVQYGVFSPINRLHSSCNPFINKEPWDYNAVTEQVMRESLKLRHQLFPYLYTMNYRTHTECKPLVMPMYYTHPECRCAYDVKNQYWFGDQMIVAPITEKNNEGSQMGHVREWLPQGIWIDFFTGRIYDGLGGRMLDLYRNDYSIPVLCKAGAIIPMQAHKEHDNRLGAPRKWRSWCSRGRTTSLPSMRTPATETNIATVRTLPQPCG
ncbi:MAG: hypothetical protein IJE62_02120 [Clostridia bacterium]|nr:hypothetical protein [Clostridia bacterium]MBQ7095781.1 hypothetical protein [Clostridia bacterium]